MPAIHGFRDTVGRPRVSTAVRLPSLGEELVIDFLLDTGADRTLIHGRDLLRFEGGSPGAGSGLTPGARVLGIGGQSLGYAEEEAEYVFAEEDGAQWSLAGRTHIALDPIAQGVPSLLGRDVLDLMLFGISEREIRSTGSGEVEERRRA